MKKYMWSKSGTRYSADADLVGHELEIIEKDNGTLKAEDVVKYARNENSELHKIFEWDDTAAAEQYRLHQARKVLFSISIVTNEDEEITESVRAYVNVVDSEENERKFKNIARVLENDEEYEQLKKKAYKDLQSCKERYENIIELQDLKELIFDLYRSL